MFLSDIMTILLAAFMIKGKNPEFAWEGRDRDRSKQPYCRISLFILTIIISSPIQSNSCEDGGGLEDLPAPSSCLHL